MRKGTIFQYECKRLLFSREYLLLLVATVLYCVSLLRGVVLYGVNFTAPFSPLTFSSYCAGLAPFLFVLLLVLCARQLKPSERGVERLISGTPLPLPTFRLLRYSAVACAFLLAAAWSVLLCFVFYWQVFDYTAVSGLLGWGLLFLLPPGIFLFGAAMFLGSRKTVAVYILLAAVFILSVFPIPLPGVMDFTGSTVLQLLPATGQAFVLPTAFLLGRMAFGIAGVCLLLASLHKSSQFQNG